MFVFVLGLAVSTRQSLPSAHKTPALNPRQRLFVREYLKDFNATQAATRAGYSKDTAGQLGHSLLKHTEIQAAVERAMAKRLQDREISAQNVLEEVRRIALTDRRGFWREDGSLKTFNELSVEQAACLEGFEIIRKNAAAGDGETDIVHKVKLGGKLPALELLMRHLGILQEGASQTTNVGPVFVLPPGTTVDIE